MEGRLDFHVHFSVDGFTEKYCAAFNAAKNRIPNAIMPEPNRDPCGDGIKQPMLVNNVQIMDIPEWPVVPSVERLRLEHQCLRTGTNSIYFSSAGQFIFFRVIKDRELRTGSFEILRVLPVPLDQLPDEMIQGRPEMVNDLACNHTESMKRRRGIDDGFTDAEGWLHRIVFGIANNFITVFLKEGQEFPVKDFDVLIGPVNFGFDGIRN